MPIVTRWSELTSWNVQNVPETEGVYELANRGQSLIYIGRSDDLQTRIREHLNTSDPCLRAAAYFRYEATLRSEDRERQLLEAYRRTYSRYPRCNDRGA